MSRQRWLKFVLTGVWAFWAVWHARQGDGLRTALYVVLLAVLWLGDGLAGVFSRRRGGRHAEGEAGRDG